MIFLSKTFEDACSISVKVGTNGFKGGDAGNGCETYLEFQFDSAEIEVDKSKCKVVIKLGGDAELRTTIEGLHFAAKSLELLSDAQVTNE